MNSLALLSQLLKKKPLTEEDNSDDLLPIDEEDISSEEIQDDDDLPGGTWNQNKADEFLKKTGPFISESQDEPLELSDDEPDISTFRQSSPFLDMLKSHLNDAPKRENYKAGTGRKLLAMLAGTVAGIRDPRQAFNVSREIVNRPYESARQDWLDRLNPLSRSAAIESNENSRTTTNYLRAVDIKRKEDYGKGLLERRDKETKRREEADRVRAENDKSRADSARINAEANRKRADRGRSQSLGSRTTAEKNIREMALNETLREYPQYRRLLDSDGRTLITPKTEQDNIDFANLYRIAKGKETQLRKQFSSEEE